MKEGKYTKIFAKIQVTAIFHMRDNRRNYVPKFIQCRALYGDALLVPTQMGTDKEVRNQQQHMLLSFAAKA